MATRTLNPWSMPPARAVLMSSLTDSAGCSVLSPMSRSATCGDSRRGWPRSARLFGYSASNPVRYTLTRAVAMPAQYRLASGATADFTGLTGVDPGGTPAARCLEDAGATASAARGFDGHRLRSASPSVRVCRRCSAARSSCATVDRSWLVARSPRVRADALTWSMRVRTRSRAGSWSASSRYRSVSMAVRRYPYDRRVSPGWRVIRIPRSSPTAINLVVSQPPGFLIASFPPPAAR